MQFNGVDGRGIQTWLAHQHPKWHKLWGVVRCAFNDCEDKEREREGEGGANAHGEVQLTPFSRVD
eukprot:scaffold171290_cov18-Tisochrysis_lutea.AAC.1